MESTLKSYRDIDKKISLLLYFDPDENGYTVALTKPYFYTKYGKMDYNDALGKFYQMAEENKLN